MDAVAGPAPRPHPGEKISYYPATLIDNEMGRQCRAVRPAGDRVSWPDHETPRGTASALHAPHLHRSAPQLPMAFSSSFAASVTAMVTAWSIPLSAAF